MQKRGEITNLKSDSLESGFLTCNLQSESANKNPVEQQ